MTSSRRLVTQHLEGVSWRVLEDYPQVVKEIIQRRAGVYALYKKNKLYYVGLASNLMGRLKNHLRDRHHGAWDRFSVYLTLRDDHIKELESLLLRIVSPEGNKQQGKFARSENLHLRLNQFIKEDDADRRAELLGGSLAKRRVRVKGKRARGKGALKGLVKTRLTLKGWRDGWEYSASLRIDGTIRYGDEVFETPDAAARAAVGRRVGGWGFWHYRNAKGEWNRLRTLKTG